MKTTECTVGEFKARFSECLKRIEQGEVVAITYGRKRDVVAMLVSPPSKNGSKKRKLGKFAGKFEVKFSPDWKITEDEFLSA